MSEPQIEIESIKVEPTISQQRELRMTFYSPPVEMSAFSGQYEWLVRLKKFFEEKCERMIYPEVICCPLCTYKEQRTEYEYLHHPFKATKRTVQSFASTIRYVVPKILIHYCEEHNHYLDTRIVELLREVYGIKKRCCVIQ